MDEHGITRYRVDRNAVEKEARERALERGIGRHPLSGDECEWWPLDVVGVLIAWIDDSLYRGRITWAEEVETQEAVTV